MLLSPTVLQIIPHLETGGAERTVIEVCEAVTRGGGRALVASEGGRLAGELAEAGGELIPFAAAAKNPLRLLANARALERLIAERGVDLVHARSRAPAWSAYLASRRAKRPFVTTYHGVYGQKSALKGWYNGVMARGDAVIANSHYTAAIVRARHKVPDARLAVIPRGVDLERFAPHQVGPGRIAAMRMSWGVAAGVSVILQAARLTAWKGQEVLIRAAALLREQNSLRDAVFVLAGDDQGRSAYRAKLVALAEQLGIAARIRLPGHCADMPAALGAAAFCVAPSVGAEAFGRASIEAQAMGCPVIVSDGGALPETLGGENGALEAGWTFRRGDPAALARALNHALSLPPEARSAVAEAARRNALRFSKTALQEKTLTVYDSLLGTKMTDIFRQAPAYEKSAHQSL